MSIPRIDLRRTGFNITALRKSKGLSVRQLMSIFGFNTPQAIYKWENGKCLPTIDNLVILASALGVTINDILVMEE